MELINQSVAENIDRSRHLHRNRKGDGCQFESMDSSSEKVQLQTDLKYRNLKISIECNKNKGIRNTILDWTKDPR